MYSAIRRVFDTIHGNIGAGAIGLEQFARRPLHDLHFSRSRISLRVRNSSNPNIRQVIFPYCGNDSTLRTHDALRTVAGLYVWQQRCHYDRVL